MLPSEIIAAIIGAISALSVVIIKDIGIQPIRDRHSSRKMLVQTRIEQAYAPLAYLLYVAVQTSNQQRKENTLQKIEAILQQYNHLLSEETASGLHVFLEDQNIGATLLHQTFFQEYEHLKNSYYAMCGPIKQHSIAERLTMAT